jgi:hypothetical protein
MGIDTGRIMLEWVAVGKDACGLVLSEHIVALVYWEDADVAEQDGEPVVTDAGFSWLPTDRPWEHFHLLAAPAPDAGGWAHARSLAAHAYLPWADARWMLAHDHAARRDETEDDTAELRREAAEFLRRSRWARDVLGHDGQQ